MALDAEQKAILDRAYKYVQRFSAIVIGFDEFECATEHGACTFLQRGRRDLIATAGHVISKDFNPPAIGFFYATRSGFSREAYRFVEVEQKGGRGSADEEWDLACALAHPPLLSKIGREALPLYRCDRNWPATPGSVVLLQGASKDLIVDGVHEDGLPTRTLIENFSLCRVMDPAQVKGPTIRCGIDFFLEHDATTMSFDDVEHPTPVGHRAERRRCLGHQPEEGRAMVRGRYRAGWYHPHVA